MKTTLLLFLIFVGLGFSNNLFAQQPDCCNINPGFFYSDTSNCEIYFYPSNYDATYDYSWDFGDGSTSNFHSPTHTYNDNSIYTVILHVSSDSCHSVDTMSVSMQTANIHSNGESDVDINRAFFGLYSLMNQLQANRIVVNNYKKLVV